MSILQVGENQGSEGGGVNVFYWVTAQSYLTICVMHAGAILSVIILLMAHLLIVPVLTILYYINDSHAQSY